MIPRSDLIREWAAAWSSRNVDIVLAFYTHDVVYEDVTFDLTFNGTDELRGFVNTMYEFCPDLTLETRLQVVDGDDVAFEWTMSGTQRGDLADIPAAGRTFSVNGMSRAEFRGDRMSLCIDYWDMATVRKCLTGGPE